MARDPRDYVTDRYWNRPCATVLFYMLIALAWVSGVVCIAAGVWMFVDPYDMLYFNVMRLSLPPIVLIGLIAGLILAGVLTGIGGILGVCGSCHDNKKLVYWFIAFTVLIMILEFLIGSVGFVIKRDIKESLESDLVIYLRENYTFDNSLGRRWNSLQITSLCCGVNGPSDYRSSNWWQDVNNGDTPDEAQIFVPVSCCKLTDSSARDVSRVDSQNPQAKNVDRCQQDAKSGNLNNDFLHGRGCISTYPKTLQFRFNVIIGLGFIFGSFQILTLVTACCLLRTLNDVKII